MVAGPLICSEGGSEHNGYRATWIGEKHMRRFAFLGVAVFGLTAGTAACGNSPVQPGVSTEAVNFTPSSGKRPSAPTMVSAPLCESLVYPTSLCMPTSRTELCAALRYGSADRKSTR